tara:strand:+ start:4019 stop:4750 length:732 start_codon:yes stop_codon:yes gene_type:complete
MALPKLVTPTFELIQPSTGKPIEFRPFLVKEEKNLLIAMEANEEQETIRAVKNVLKDCIISPLNIDKIPSFDIEYIFLNIRAKSVGELLELRYRHIDGINSSGDKCNHVQDVEIDINEIECKAADNHPDKKIQLTDSIGILLRYPTLDDIERSQKKKTEVDATFSLVASIIESVWDGIDVTETADVTASELHDFIGQMSSEQFEKIKLFFETMPKVRHILKYTCAVCGDETEIVLEGLQSFFT